MSARRSTGRTKTSVSLLLLCISSRLGSLCTSTVAAAAQVCGESGVDGVCDTSSSSQQQCQLMLEDSTWCQGPPPTIYGTGGTAVAYVPHQPMSSTICNPATASSSSSRSSSTKYRVARWSYSRSTWTMKKQQQLPVIHIKINLQTCSTTATTTKINKNDKNDSSCCCSPLRQESRVEVWQTRPDGTYSSLIHNNNKGGECRATGVTTRNGSVEFTTLPPGSTGLMGGLGPSGWDWAPYGPPVIHILVTGSSSSSTTTTALFDIPILFHMKTLAQTTFYGSDWRGAAWVRSTTKERNPRYRFVSWNGSVEHNRIDIELDLFLPHQSSSSNNNNNTTRRHNESLTSVMCPSLIYGLPTSFFLEPIAVCAPSMLDFFEL